MPESTTGGMSFRHRLDAVLRTRDVKQISDFLIDEGQWEPGTPADPEFAMWMMIAGSPSLRELHEQARLWLIKHGHEAEANMVLRPEKAGGNKQEKHAAPPGKKGGRSSSGSAGRGKAGKPAQKRP